MNDQMSCSVVAKDWAEYDRLLRSFDAGKGPEPEGPEADLSAEPLSPGTRVKVLRNYPTTCPFKYVPPNTGRKNKRGVVFAVLDGWVGCSFLNVTQLVWFHPEDLGTVLAK